MTCPTCSARLPVQGGPCPGCATSRPRRPRLGLVLPGSTDAPAPQGDVADPGAPELSAPPAAAATPSRDDEDGHLPYVPAPRPAAPSPAPADAGHHGPPRHPAPVLHGLGAAVPVPPPHAAPARGTEALWQRGTALARRRPGLAAALSLVAVVLAGGAAVGGPRTIEGTMTLYDGEFWDLRDGSSCTGSDAGYGYADISPGTPVVVRGDSGELVGRSRLTRGLVSGGGCVFDFQVEVDHADTYEVETADRGSLYYSEEELDSREWTVELTLGGD